MNNRFKSRAPKTIGGMYFGQFVVMCLIVGVRGHTYLHIPSRVELQNKLFNDDFGFSLAYQEELNRMVVGAPHSENKKGQVYSCNMSNQDCVKVDLNMELESQKPHLNPAQSYCLGASVAAIDDHFLTCAPLIHRRFQLEAKGAHYYHTGDCYIIDKEGNSERYNGIAKQRSGHESNKDTAHMKGGVGWSTFVDKRKNRILISKSTLTYNDIVYLNWNKSRTNVISMAYKDTNQFDEDKINTGVGLAAGKFFTFDESMYYAFNYEDTKRQGRISFINTDNMRLRLDVNTTVTIFGPVGAMFGVSLSASDLDGDGFDDLFVGAPAYSDDDHKSNVGALYIYRGGNVRTIDQPDNKQVIVGTESGGMFGSCVASTDIDGDGKSEIFVSAPYEYGGTGALYIISGYEISNLFVFGQKYSVKTISELRLTQRIQIEHFRTFGFSLKVIPRNTDGCNGLAVGSPKNSSVLLFKCLRAFEIYLSIGGINNLNLSVSETEFQVCVNTTYPTQGSQTYIGSLKVLSEISGPASLTPPEYTIDLSDKLGSKCRMVGVKFMGTEPSDHTIKVRVDTKHLEAAFESNNFETRWMNLRSYNKREESKTIRRECLPTKIDVKTLWNGSEDTTTKFLLGSEKEASFQVIINTNDSVCQRCVKVLVEKTQLAPSEFVQVACGKDEANAFTCYLLKTMSDKLDYPLNFTFAMNKLNSRDEEIVITTRIYNHCNSTVFDERTTSVKLVSDFTDDFKVSGLSRDLEITDVQLKSETISVSQEYTIFNQHLLTWSDVTANIMVAKIPSTKEYRISTSQNKNCTPSVGDKIVQFICELDNIPAKSTIKIMLTAELFASKIETYNTSVIESNMTLTSARKDRIEQSLKTVISYKKEMTFGNNRPLIISLSIIMALIIVGVIIFILFKIGFFNRKSKQRLDEYKQSIQNRSNPEPVPTSSIQPSEPHDPDYVEMTDMAVEDHSFELVNDADCFASNADLIDRKETKDKKQKSIDGA